jgi:hypothetical protein
MTAIPYHCCRGQPLASLVCTVPVARRAWRFRLWMPDSLAFLPENLGRRFAHEVILVGREDCEPIAHFTGARKRP